MTGSVIIIGAGEVLYERHADAPAHVTLRMKPHRHHSN
ncbi:MAG: hypothetical protein K0S90_1 [Enterobacteriaceae bacterium]|jgi:hypothetical protein|nr:hypothetical protein [Enterobacteriaceae bacterium]